MVENFVQGVSIIQGSDGLNYDEVLEHLFQVLSKNDLTDRETILHNLKIYTETYTHEGPTITEALLDDTEMAVRWSSSISSLQIWKLTQHQQVAHANDKTHEWGALLYGGSCPVTAFDIRTAALLAVVQRYRELSATKLNPEKPTNLRLQ